jgi:hypothetical protein
MPSKRTDTIQVIMPSGRMKTKYKKVCELCDVVFYSYRETSRCCSQSHFLRLAYLNNERDSNTICKAANKASKTKGYKYRIGKPIYSIRGVNHWAWKGGVTNKNDIIRRSVSYKNWRKAVFERDNYTCVECSKQGAIFADHIKGFAEYPDLRFDIDNGRTLCRGCHYYATYKRKMPSNSKWCLTTAVAGKRG